MKKGTKRKTSRKRAPVIDAKTRAVLDSVDPETRAILEKKLGL